MGWIKKVIVKFELWVTKSSKPKTLLIAGATATNIADLWRCAYKVSRPGLKKFNIDAIYINPLQ